MRLSDLLLLTIILNSYSSFAQDSGIYFESTLSWKEIKAKAKQENKFIFLDCYATWCGPCKYMSERIFTQKGVGDFVNAHFISVAIQMDKTSKDMPAIQNWYKDAAEIKQQYNISAYPTYLFFAPDGEPVHQIVGAASNETEFISKVKESMDAEKQYFTIVEEVNNHLNDSAFLRVALDKATKNFDIVNAEIIANAYIVCIKSPFSEDALRLTCNVIRNSKDTLFKFFFENSNKIDSILNKSNFAERRIAFVINAEDIKPIFHETSGPLPWTKIKRQVAEKYANITLNTINLLYLDYQNEILKKE